MRVSHIKLHKFKRFHDLTITGIPETAKLVVVTGPNGTGKSTVLEALNYTRRISRWGSSDPNYFNKQEIDDGLPSAPLAGHQLVEMQFHDRTDLSNLADSIWVRPAYRHEPEFMVNAIGSSASPIDDPGLERLINMDQLVSQNYTRLINQSINSLYQATAETTAGDIRNALVGRLQESMSRVFGDLKLDSLTNPLGEGTFYFSKGNSQHFPFKHLSAGERAAFDILLDILARSQTFTDTVYAIDEPELHIGSRVQGLLLEEMLNALEGSRSQLWVATHSPGMMKKAIDLYNDDPSSVAFLDTHGQDFDKPVVMQPVVPNRDFWRRGLEVALDDMASLVAPKRIVLCEGEELQLGFDARIYRKIFEEHYPDTEFLSVGSSHQVKRDQQGIAKAIQVIAPGTKIVRLIDRDDHSDPEVSELRKNGIKVLSLRNIESYLLADEIINKLYVSYGRESDAALVEMAELLADSRANRGNPSDDFKPIIKAFRSWLRKDLELNSQGNDTLEFVLNVITPHITPGTSTYDQLETDIFDETESN